MSFQTIEELKAARELGLDDSFLNDYQTAESYSLESAKLVLNLSGRSKGFITQNDLKGMPAAITQDSDVSKWLKMVASGLVSLRRPGRC